MQQDNFPYQHKFTVIAAAAPTTRDRYPPRLPTNRLQRAKIAKAESRDKSKNKVFQNLAMPRRILSKTKSKIEAESRGKPKNKVFQIWLCRGASYPRRSQRYQYAESRGKPKNKVFQNLTRPRRILSKTKSKIPISRQYSASKRKKIPFRTYSHTFGSMPRCRN